MKNICCIISPYLPEGGGAGVWFGICGISLFIKKNFFPLFFFVREVITF